MENTTYCRSFYQSHFTEVIFETIENKPQLSILFYPSIFTGEELRYEYGVPHAEWIRNPEAPGTKINTEAVNS